MERLNVKTVFDTLKASGKFDDDSCIEHYMMSRMHDLSSRLLVGQRILNKQRIGTITLKPYKELTDEEFVTLIFDLYISDRQMAKIFGVSDSTISRRRYKFNILRSNHEEALQTYQWMLSKRIAPDVDEFLDSISI